MCAGLQVGWSNTDGVYVQGELVEAGDWSGPGGARQVLAQPGVQLGVLETARGGMLLRGMGYAHNDVAVVTNVTADHLGLQGIDTLDQLAEVKAVITTVTRPDGWLVLNGDDPRVLAMHRGARAKPWVFSLDPSSPALREALDAGGRGATRPGRFHRADPARRGPRPGGGGHRRPADPGRAVLAQPGQRARGDGGGQRAGPAPGGHRGGAAQFPARPGRTTPAG